MGKNKKFLYAKKFDGEPKPTDFKLVEEEIPSVKNGEVHFEALFLSVDPYMRPVANMYNPGITMFGSQVAKVVESKHKDFKVGDVVVGDFGWQTHYVGNPDEVMSPFGGKNRPYVLPDFKGLPYSLALGALGMPGNTAYFGLLELCKPKAGETVVVSGAAGAVGSLVGQIAKAKGCIVIGFAGSDDKVNWLKNELKFDHAFNYKKIGISEALAKGAPNGVDCYFDNVGGKISSDVLAAMNTFGRVAVCGSISSYNATSPPLAPVVQTSIVLKQLKVEGFLVQRWSDRWFEGIKNNIEWIKQGKIVYKEHVTDGFEKMADAFIGLFKGDSTGKAVIKV